MNESVAYTLRRSARSRSVRLTVRPGGSIVVTAPHWLGMNVINRFLLSKKLWILEKLKVLSGVQPTQASTRKQYLQHREQARRMILGLLEHWNKHFGFSYGRVAIKDHHSMWGSCSRKGNLNFNYRLLFLPKELQDYVVVHELCHLKEPNHSKSFWVLVKQALPDYNQLRLQLKSYQANSAY